MRHVTPVSSPLKFFGLATVLGTVVAGSAVVLPAHAADFYYPERYERLYRYYGGEAPRRHWPDTYDPRIVHGSPYGCWNRDCGRTIVRHRPIVERPYPVIERRYVEREYVERRYPGPWREDDRDGLFGYGGVPRPPAAIPSVPSHYYGDDDER